MRRPARFDDPIRVRSRRPLEVDDRRRGRCAHHLHLHARAQIASITQQSQSGGAAVAYKRAEFVYNQADDRSGQKFFASPGASQLVIDASRGYDLLGRLESATYRAADLDLLGGYTWLYDEQSRVTRFTSSADGTADDAYDAYGQLLAADYTDQADESYTDSGGDRVTSNGATFATPTGDAHRLHSDGTFSYEYDTAGRRTLRRRIAPGAAADQETHYTWDALGRLTDVVFTCHLRRSAAGPCPAGR